MNLLKELVTEIITTQLPIGYKTEEKLSEEIETYMNTAETGEDSE